MVSYQSIWQNIKCGITYLALGVPLVLSVACGPDQRRPSYIEIQGDIKPEISVPLDHRGNPLLDTSAFNGMVKVVNSNGEAKEYQVTYAPPVKGQGIGALARRFNCGADRAQLNGLVLLMANLINSDKDELGDGARIVYYQVTEAPNLLEPSSSRVVLYPVVQDPSLQCKR